MAATPIPVDENGNPIAPAPIAPATPIAPVAPAVSTAAAAPAPAAPIPVDEQGNPITSNGQPGESWFTHWMNQNMPSFLQPANVHEASDLAARSYLRANPLLAAPNAAFVGGQLGGDLLARKTGFKSPDEAYTPINPLESLIGGTGEEMAPDAGPGMRIADQILPWLRMSPSQGTRAAEAPGAFNTVMTAARSEAGNLTDWFLSDEAQQWAKDHGMGQLAQMLAGMAGGSVRTPATRVTTPFVRKVIPGKSRASETVDETKSLDPDPQTGVSTVPDFRDVADPTSSVARFISGEGAIPFSGTGEASATNAQTAAIGRTADNALQQLSPGTTSVFDAGPSSMRSMGSKLKDQAQSEVLDNERFLMGRSDALDNTIGTDTRVDATPLRDAAMQIATGNHAQIIKDQAQKFVDNLDRNIGSDGKIAYGVLKGERSAFGQYLASQATPATGDVTVKNTLASALDPIRDAITERMSSAAHDVSPEVGAAWDQNDQAWKLQAIRKQNLQALSGDLNPDRTGFATSPGGKQVANTIDKAVAGEKPGTGPIANIEAGFPDDTQARSAVAETIASRARPKGSDSTQTFRPATFGEGVDARVDPDILKFVEQKAGPEARQKLETAASVGSSTSEPRQQGGLRSAIGSIVGAAPYAGAGAAAFGPAGLALSPLVALLTSVSRDPDLIRTVANRNVPFSSLVPQIIQHAAVGAEPDNIPAVQTLQYGVGQAANALRSGANTAVNTVPSILKFLSNPKPPEKLRPPGGQR